jgi:hypothetical protein
MYLQKGISSVANPDPLVRGMGPRIQIRIRIHTKKSWNRNTGANVGEFRINTQTQLIQRSMRGCPLKGA